MEPTRIGGTRRTRPWAERPIAVGCPSGNPGGVLGVLLLVGSLVPLAAMMIALFAAAWIREGRRADAPTPR
jgi:ABC-type uncharacterized transport system YnjBCD permease subunit